MQFEDDFIDEYDEEHEFGEDPIYEVDDDSYDKAFDEEEVPDLKVSEGDSEKVEYEFDEIVGGRDKKPVMSKLNQRVISKYEMDDLLNEEA
jgi:hypothetical protein